MVRNKVVGAMERWKYLLQLWAKLDDDEWKKRVECMREDKSWGGTLELISVSLAFKVGIRQQWCNEGELVLELDTTQTEFGEGLNLVHMHNHYNCVSRTESRPVKGVGLLPLSSIEQWIKSKTAEYDFDPMKQNASPMISQQVGCNLI